MQAISRVHLAIFTKTYFGSCMECSFCYDGCCQHGTEVELEEIGRIENYIQEKRGDWFQACPYDEYEENDVLSGFKCTQVRERGCVFLKRTGRKCTLHSFSLEKDRDYHVIKPMVCCLFPTSINNGLLGPAYQVRENSLVCLGKGSSLYQGVRNEIAFYFGEKLITELDKMESEILTL